MEKWKYPLGNSFSDRCDSFSDRCDSELCLPACLLASPLSLACRLPGLPGFSASMASSQRGYDSISICCRAITSDALSSESSRCHLFSRIMASSSKHYHLIFTRDFALSLHIEYESPRCIVLSSECSSPLPASLSLLLPSSCHISTQDHVVYPTRNTQCVCPPMLPLQICPTISLSRARARSLSLSLSQSLSRARQRLESTVVAMLSARSLSGSR